MQTPLLCSSTHLLFTVLLSDQVVQPFSAKIIAELKNLFFVTFKILMSVNHHNVNFEVYYYASVGALNV